MEAVRPVSGCTDIYCNKKKGKTLGTLWYLDRKMESAPCPLVATKLEVEGEDMYRSTSVANEAESLKTRCKEPLGEIDVHSCYRSPQLYKS